MSLAPPTTKMTFEEFHDWLDDTTWAEWVDGEVIVLSPVELRHVQITGFLIRLLGHIVEGRDLGLLLSAPFLVRLPERLRRGREPDLLFVSQERRNIVRRTYIDGAPDLVIEIVSPESVSRDYREKFLEYEQAGVREYWLIDPDRARAELYRLDGDGKYQLALGGTSGEYRTDLLPGLRLRLDWLWREPPPKVVDVLREMELN